MSVLDKIKLINQGWFKEVVTFEGNKYRKSLKWRILFFIYANCITTFPPIFLLIYHLISGGWETIPITIILICGYAAGLFIYKFVVPDNILSLLEKVE